MWVSQIVNFAKISWIIISNNDQFDQHIVNWKIPTGTEKLNPVRVAFISNVLQVATSQFATWKRPNTYWKTDSNYFLKKDIQ